MKKVDIDKRELDMTIVMMAFDSYSDVWEGFIYCKEKYWADCLYPMIIVTCEKRNVPYGIDEVITTGGQLEWTERLHQALEQIDTEYILFMLEDLYIDRKVDSNRIEQCIDLMKQFDIGHLRLMTDIKYQREFEPDHRYGEYMVGHAYRISTHPAIWKREYLFRLTEKPMNAWDFERVISYESGKYPERCLCTKETVVSFTNTIWRQKWTREGINLCKNEGLVIDYETRSKHNFWDNFKIDIGNLAYSIIGADRVNKVLVKRKK